MNYGEIVNIQHFCMHDGPGIRTTVFLKGCPLRCLWCSNPNSQKPEVEIAYAVNKCILCKKCIDVCEHGVLSLEDGHIAIDRSKCTMCGKCVNVCPGRAIHFDGKHMSLDEVMDEVVADMTCYHNSSGGMTLSGGEALMQKDFTLALLTEAKRLGIHTAIETTAQTTYKVFSDIIKLVDYLIIDMKHGDAKKHKEVTGVDNMLIKENIIRASKEHPNLHIRIPVIPSINDTKEDLAKIAFFLKPLDGIKSIELLQYHDFGKTKYAQIGLKYPLEDVKKYDLNHLTSLLAYFRELVPNHNVLCQGS